MKKNKNRILVVEDEEDFAEYLQHLFESRDFIVDIATNGNMALEYLALHRYDVITLDLLLPDMNGTEILKDIRAREKTQSISTIPVPIVIISTNPDDGKKRLPEFLHEAKGIYWIQKPMPEGEPLLTIDYALLLAKKALGE